MQRRKLGGLEVSAVGLGCGTMTPFYDAPDPDSALAAVQIEYSLWTRDVEAEVLPLCEELGIGFVAYSPLGRGFLTGGVTSVEGLREGDARRRMPRFQPENLARNLALVEELKAHAA